MLALNQESTLLSLNIFLKNFVVTNLSNMKLKSGSFSLILAFGCGLFWIAVPARSAPLWREEVGFVIEDNVNSRSNRDVGAVVWPIAWEADHGKPAGTTRNVRTPESMKEAVLMIDDFWRFFGNDADTEDQMEEEMEKVLESDNTFTEESDEINQATETDELITSRFSSDSYQETTDLQQPPQQHLSLYPPYLPGYAPQNSFHGNYLLRPPPPTMYSSTSPLSPYYGNTVVPGDIPVPHQDSEMDMEFHGNRVPSGMTPVAYARSMSPHQSQYTLQYPPVHPQLLLNYYMTNAANFQNPHMNPGTPHAPQMGYSIPGGATPTSQVSSSIPQPSYPFLGTSLTYPYHQ